VLCLSAVLAVSAGPVAFAVTGRFASEATVRAAGVAVATAILLPPTTTTTSTTTTPRPVIYARHWGAHRGYPTAAACIAAVEHGGAYDRSSNPSHFGRYQFSRGTWIAYGGNPATWGNATPQEQDAVFARAVAAGGLSNWLPYDGC